MKDYECSDDWSGQHHRTRRPARTDIGPLDVRNRSCILLDPEELDGRPYMQRHTDQKYRAHSPKQGGIAVQGFSVMVHHFTADENLQITKHVHDQESKQDQTTHGHDGFLADRGFFESRHAHQLRISDYRTHE